MPSTNIASVTQTFATGSYLKKLFSVTVIQIIGVLISPLSTALAAEEASLLITHGTILTMDKNKTIIHDGVVVVRDNKIIAVGDNSLLQHYSSNITLDVDGDIVMPGLINTHTHISMTVFRTLGEDISNRLHKYLFPLESQFVDEEMVAYSGHNWGALEHIKGGTTTLAGYSITLNNRSLT